MAWLESFVFPQKPFFNRLVRCNVYLFDFLQLDCTDTLFEKHPVWIFFKPAFEVIAVGFLADCGTDALLYFVLIDLGREKKKSCRFLFINTKSSRAENN
jgi:hypothetical protein